MKLLTIGGAAAVALTLMLDGAFGQDAVRKELTPTGKLRVGIALGLTPGVGNVVMDASGEPRGVSADLGRARRCRGARPRVSPRRQPRVGVRPVA